MAGQAGAADHVHLGDGVVLGTRCGATRDLPAGGGRYLGEPALPAREHHRLFVSLCKLPEMRRELLHIKNQLGI